MGLYGNPYIYIHHIRRRFPDDVSGGRFNPSLNIAIEYQGVKHYEPVGFFSGKDGFAHRSS